MIISVYCITKNEEKFVDRMIQSVLDADEILICDTGSDDGTVARIETWIKRHPGKIKLQHIHVKPWRFDVARNTSLSMVRADADICLCLDLDEVMIAGWRQEIEKVWVPGKTTRGKYNYVWSFENGKPSVSFHADKIHARNNYRWHHPVHEVLKNYWIEEVSVVTGAEMHHYPDPTKSRGQYLPLLELAAHEDPHCDRNAFYLGREYYFYRQYEKAIVQMAKYRALPTAKWTAERGSSWRIAGRCNAALGRKEEALACFQEAPKECPEMRESWTELAQCYHDLQMWAECRETCIKALEIKEMPNAYITERAAYGSIAHDLKSVAAWCLGDREEAIAECKLALVLSPSDERIRNNLAFMSAAE